MNKNTEHIKSEILNCIKDAHSFSKNLGESSSIKRDYICEMLKDFSSTDIHIALLDLQVEGKLNYNLDSDLITNIKI